MRIVTVLKRHLSHRAPPLRICTSLNQLPHNLDGLLLPLVKPVGPTSQQCLTRLKRLIGGKKLRVFAEPGSTCTVKVGYAGTLDPLACPPPPTPTPLALLVYSYASDFKHSQHSHTYILPHACSSGLLICGFGSATRDLLAFRCDRVRDHRV